MARTYWWGIGGAVVAAAVAVAGVWYTRQAAHPVPLSPEDTVESWTIPASHTGEAVQKVHDDIVRFKGMVGEGEFTDYELYVTIANLYELVGEGENAYNYYGKALKIDTETTGLAWHNLGQLMDKLGAYHTARYAFKKATDAEPLLQYHMAYLEFLKERMPEDTVAVEEQEAIIKAYVQPAIE